MAKETGQVLIFAAHPDDETNGCGGTLLRLREEGWSVHIVYATGDGVRQQEAAAAAKCLDATHECWGLPDGRLEATAETRQMGVDVFNRINPDLVLVMSGNDVHPDHRAMNDIALTPTMQRGCQVECLAYELWSHGRGHGGFPQTVGFVPTHYVDTTKLVHDEKVAELVRCHVSQDPEAMIEGMAQVHRARAKETGWRPYGCDDYPLPKMTSMQAEAFVRLTRAPIQPFINYAKFDLFRPGPVITLRGGPKPIANMEQFADER